METIKTFITLIVATIVAAFKSIVLPITLYGILFAFDVLFGIIADRAVNKQAFSTRKFLRAIVLLLCYCCVNFIVAAICYLSNTPQHADTFVQIVTIVCAVFYAQNIFKNLHAAYPEVRFFRFMHWLVGLGIVDKLPFLQKFIDFENKEKQTEK